MIKYIFASLLILPNIYVNSQQTAQIGFYEDITKKLNLATPNAAAFEEFSFNKVNHYSGSVAKSISLFDVKVGRINYPISLNYYLGGIKVNTISSDVGLGWSLSNASITRTINDILDTYESIYESDTQHYINYDPATAYWSNGTLHTTMFTTGPWFAELMKSYYNGSFRDPKSIGYHTKKQHNIKQTKYYKVDKFPDIYNVSVPNGHLNFYFPENNTNAINLNNNNYKIIPYIGFKPLVYSLYAGQNVGRAIKDYVKFDIIDDQGIIYTFEKADYSQNISFQYRASSDSPSCGNNPGPPNYSGIDKTEGDSWNAPKAVTWHITKIKDPTTNDEINFEYETFTSENTNNTSFSTFVNNNRPYFRSESRIYKSNYTLYDTSCKLPKNEYCQSSPVVRTYVRLIEGNRLKKIVFKNGSVNFDYNHNRQDYSGGKAITAISIKDTNNNVIKHFNLSYSYFNSLPYKNEFSKRLKLESIQEIGKPPYEFEYFEDNNMPQIGSFNQDIFGYCNTNIDTDHAEISNPNRAKYYFYPNQKEYSLLPYNISGLQKFDLGGTINKEPNEYAKTWSLKKINFPTGGYQSFDLETNTFNLLNNNLKGSGIRVKSQTIHDPENPNAPMRVLNYNYNLDTGLTSGILHNIPFIGYPLKKFYDSSYGGVNGDDESIINSNAAIFTGLQDLYKYFMLDTNPNINSGLIEKNSIGYSQVVESEGTHKTSYKFFNEEFKNEINRRYKRNNGISPYTTYHTGNGMPTSCMSMWLHINSGLGIIEGTLNKDMARGVPKEINYFDGANKIRSEKYEYINYFNRDISLSHISPIHFYFSKIDEAQFTSTQSSTYDNFELMYFDKSFITQDNYLKSKEVIDYHTNGQTKYKENYHYLNNVTGKKPYLTKVKTEFSSGENKDQTFEYTSDQHTNLIDHNMLGIRLKEVNSKNNITNGTTISSYENLLPKSVVGYSPIDASVVDGIYYDLYDNNGNLLQYHDKSDLPTTLIYGYNQTQPIAKIEGATYAQIQNLTVAIISASDLDANAIPGSNETALLTALDNFRRNPALSNFQITTYTYDPLIGVRSITPPSGIREIYHYDSANRLEKIVDINGNILKEFKYNYKQ